MGRSSHMFYDFSSSSLHVPPLHFGTGFFRIPYLKRCSALFGILFSHSYRYTISHTATTQPLMICLGTLARCLCIFALVLTVVDPWYIRLDSVVLECNVICFDCNYFKQRFLCLRFFVPSPFVN